MSQHRSCVLEHLSLQKDLLKTSEPQLYTAMKKMKLVLKYLTSISITSEINLHIYQFSTSEKQFSSEMLNVQVIPVQNSQG